MEPLYSICIGDMEIRPHEHSLRVHGHEVPLTFREYSIVTTLAEHPGWAYSVSQLSEDVEEIDYSPESVSVLVSRARKKLTAAGAPGAIETVRGIGYRLHASSSGCDVEPRSAAGGDRELKDALWQLQEAVIEVRRVGDEAHKREVVDLLERARRTIYQSLE